MTARVAKSGNAVPPWRLAFGFWAAAIAIVAIVIGANTALPILTVYQSLRGFSTGVLSVVYGIYTIGVLAAAFILGPTSGLVGSAATAAANPSVALIRPKRPAVKPRMSAESVAPI